MLIILGLTVRHSLTALWLSALDRFVSVGQKNRHWCDTHLTHLWWWPQYWARLPVIGIVVSRHCKCERGSHWKNILIKQDFMTLPCHLWNPPNWDRGADKSGGCEWLWQTPIDSVLTATHDGKSWSSYLTEPKSVSRKPHDWMRLDQFATQPQPRGHGSWKKQQDWENYILRGLWSTIIVLTNLWSPISSIIFGVDHKASVPIGNHPLLLNITQNWKFQHHHHNHHQ